MLTTGLSGPVSRIMLQQRICRWMCSEALLHEHSEEVAMNIQNAVQGGTVQAAAPGTRACLVWRDTSPDLWLKVNHELVMGVKEAEIRQPWVVNGHNTYTPDSREACQAIAFYDNFTPEKSRHIKIEPLLVA